MTNPLGLSCPRGGDWYICQGTTVEFVGCCTSDPCADGTGFCEEGRLRPASFSASQYSKIPALQCDDRNPRPDTAPPFWYTCMANNPPFLGCCYNNPCVAGSCPDVNLTAAKMTDEPQIRENFLRDAGEVTTGEKKGLSGGAIAGIVVGVVAALALAIGAWWYMRRRKQKHAGEKAPLASDGLHLSPDPNSSHFSHSPHPCKHFFPETLGNCLIWAEGHVLTGVSIPAAVSPHSGYTYPGTPPQGHGFENGSYYSAPTELGSPSHYVAELSASHAGDVAMLDSKPVGQHQANSPTIPSSEATTDNKWPTDKK